jgi:glycosyltransferase involved in cell wall biosynthesis
LKLLIVTDAWTPQTNGVVTTLQQVIAELQRLNIEVEVLAPEGRATLPLPGYPEIRVALNPWIVRREIRRLKPDSIHIATEGPLGLVARQLLMQQLIPFTTSLHTKFPEYIQARVGLPLAAGYAFLRWFHRPAVNTLVTTERHKAELAGWGMDRLVVWGRGVDVEQFHPHAAAAQPALSGRAPRLLYVGRVAVEKNLEEFLRLPEFWHKTVVGDGPARAELQRRYPLADWRGYLHGADLAAAYAAADAFVFPSKTDTFGLVMLEAMACGTPVAAYPVTGPADLIVEGRNGALDTDLAAAVARALVVDRGQCREFALSCSWTAVAERLLDNLAMVDWQRRGALIAPERRAA